MKPWIDRSKLVATAQAFVRQYGYFFNQEAKRISSLVEIAVYNSFVRFYADRGYKVTGQQLGPKKSFLYKLTSAGLAENFSFFLAEKKNVRLHLLHNTSVQSAHHDHLYFTSDVVVTNDQGATTKVLKKGRRHSFVENANLVSFAEVKHLNPFPEALFNFSGLVLEFMPGLIEKQFEIRQDGYRLCPVIAFTGPGSDHAERIREELTNRYGINIVFGTMMHNGRLAGMKRMNRYRRPTRASVKRVVDD